MVLVCEADKAFAFSLRLTLPLPPGLASRNSRFSSPIHLSMASRTSLRVRLAHGRRDLNHQSLRSKRARSRNPRPQPSACSSSSSSSTQAPISTPTRLENSRSCRRQTWLGRVNVPISQNDDISSAHSSTHIPAPFCRSWTAPQPFATGGIKKKTFENSLIWTGILEHLAPSSCRSYKTSSWSNRTSLGMQSNSNNGHWPSRCLISVM